MDNSTEHEAAECDMDHGLRDVDPLLVIANEPFPARHPTESALHDPRPWPHLEARLLVRAADDLKDEVLIGRGIHKAGAVVGAVGEQVLHSCERPRRSLERGRCRKCRRWSD